MQNFKKCDSLLEELNAFIILLPEGSHRGHVITARLFDVLFNNEDETSLEAACNYVHAKQLTPKLLKLVEHVVDSQVGSLHLQCTWDTIDAAFGILDNYCTGSLCRAEAARCDMAAHNALLRTISILQRCFDFEARWVERSSALESLLLLTSRLLRFNGDVIELEAIKKIVASLSKLMLPVQERPYKICSYLTGPCIYTLLAIIQRFGISSLLASERNLLKTALRKKTQELHPTLLLHLDLLAVLGHLCEDEEAVSTVGNLLRIKERLLMS